MPEDVAIVGYDDIPMAQFTNPALSSVQQDTRRAGELLVDTLLKLVHGEPAQPLKLAPQLIVRQSCGMPLQPTRSPATVTALPTRARRASRGARH